MAGPTHRPALVPILGVGIGEQKKSGADSSPTAEERTWEPQPDQCEFCV